MMYVLIVFLPLIAALLAGLFGRSLGDRPSQIITSGAVIVSAVLSWVALYQIAFQQTTETIELLKWIDSGDFDVSWALRIDSLTAVMLVVVYTVSAGGHDYSLCFLSNDRTSPRFMSYISCSS